MSIRFSILIVFITGFIALSYEILWFRVYSFVSGSKAHIFATLLGSYLLGIALGSFFVRKFCETKQNTGRGLYHLSMFIIIANVLGYLTIPFISNAVRIMSYKITFLGIVISAGFLGALFPLIAHLGIHKKERAGEELSYVYLSNILGSTTGSLITGFVLFDLLSLKLISLLLLFLGLIVAILILVPAGYKNKNVRKLALIASMIMVIALPFHFIFNNTFEKLLHRSRYKPNEKFKYIIENHSGVITVTQDDKIFGGGAYDGVFNVDITNDVNGIIRPYFIAAVHENPKEIFIVGLGSGSWSAVLANHPKVEKITIVEINGGYAKILKKYPFIGNLLKDKKVQIITDDARRWLRNNPDKKFDAIVQNTTWNWRMLVSSLLSKEYFTLIKKHLKPGGVFLFNATSSKRAYKTALKSFRYAIGFQNSCLASDNPINVDNNSWLDIILQYEVYGKKIVTGDELQKNKILADLEKKLLDSITSQEDLIKNTQNEKIITDNNMGTEWQ